MDNSADFSSFEEKVTAALKRTTRTVNRISSEDIDFHRASSSEFAENLDEQSERLLSLTSSLLKAATGGTHLEAPALEDEDALDNNWRGIVDVIDNLLEKADACLDEFTGIIKKLSPPQQDRPQNAGNARQGKTFPTVYDYGPSKIPKPQLLFRTLPNNQDMSPFRPLLTSKPNAIVSLKKSLHLKGKPAFYPNPYEKEIREAKYTESAYAVAPPTEFGPVETTEAVWVDTPEGVAEMVEELKRAKEIAVDLEHHDVHSYHGLVSLMQISTRNKDWVVDTLKPWREDLQQLNEVFTDPKILKVFHGSTMDIVWLQRDLGLYVVGMFDTYHAAVALGYPKRSLKFLLEKFAHYEADKKYQMADWRLRPLTEEMLRYARADTHYLLYVYDCMRNELVEKSTDKTNLVDYVLERSKSEALQRYERPVYDVASGQGAGGWYDLLSRNSILLSKEQFSVFKAVHEWRDQVAREQDEGLQCVFPRHALFKLAAAMPLDKHTLFKTLSPVTLLVKDRVKELMDVIKKAKIEGATGPELRDVIKPKKTVADAAAAASKPSLPEVDEIPTSVSKANIISVVRADSSQFWGAALQPQEASVVPLKYKVAASFEALKLSVPIPPMPVTISEVREQIKDVSSAVVSAEPSPMASPSARKADQKNDIITVKEIAPRVKRKTIEEEMKSDESDQSTSSSGSGSDESEEDSSSGSEEDEIEQHIAKKPRKETTPKKNRTPQKEKEEGPLNYDSAPSMLRSKELAEAKASAAGFLNQKKTFNPYAKSLNAPSGARKSKKEISGRTHTYR